MQPVRARGRRAALLALVVLAASVALVPAAGATAPTFIAATSAGTGGNAPNLTVAKPAGTMPGDVMLAKITFTGGSLVPLAAPPGWALVVRTNSTTVLGQAAFVKVANASEGGNYTWGFGANRRAVGAILSFDAVDNAMPVDAAAGQANAVSFTATAPGINTTRNGTMLVGLFGANDKTNFSPPANMTERTDLDQSQVSGETATQLRGPTGPTGQRNATLLDEDAVNIGQLVALKPLPIPGNVQCAVDGSAIQVTWDAVANATLYKVYRSVDADPYLLVGSTPNTTFTDGTVTPGETYTYYVTSVTPGGESEPSATCTIMAIPLFPGVLAVPLAVAGGLGAYAWARRRR